MNIPYRELPDVGTGVMWAVFLGVQFSRPAPGSPRTNRLDCLLDSGASKCLFHADIASVLGLDLKTGQAQTLRGISGPERCWTHEIALHLPGGSLQVSAAFKEGLGVAGLLGMQGFFEHFIVTFDPALRLCTLDRVYRL